MFSCLFILDFNLVGFFATGKAGVVGIGNVDGQNIYDATGGMTNGLDVGYSALPSPNIENYNED